MIMPTATEGDLLDAIAAEFDGKRLKPGDVTKSMICEKLNITDEQARTIMDEWADRPGYIKVKVLDPDTGKFVAALRKA